MKIVTFIVAITAGILVPTLEAASQWRPTGMLIDIPILKDCSLTDGAAAARHPGGIALCPARLAAIEEEIPDASHFAVVQIYGLFAMQTSSEKLADCWAARRLSSAPNGPYYVKQWMRYWRTHGRIDPTYGSPEDRISSVRSCCSCGA